MNIDWKKSEDSIVDFTKVTLRRFADEHPNEKVCAIFFDTEPRHGYVHLAFDTIESNRNSVKQLEQFVIKGRSRMLNEPDAWKNAKYFVGTPVLSTFNTNCGDFSYMEYSAIQFEEWVAARAMPDYPQSSEHENDYLDGNVRITFWKVVERLFNDDSFKCLSTAEPCVIGYTIHDEEECILRFIKH